VFLGDNTPGGYTMGVLIDFSQLLDLLVGADSAAIVLSEPSFCLILCLLALLDDPDAWEFADDELEIFDWLAALDATGQAVWELIPDA
jgi:hypothetical protein